MPVTGVKLDQTELALTVGETAVLKVTVEPAGAEVQTSGWSVNPDGIADVTPGDGGSFTLRGLNSGNAVFKVTAGGLTADCLVSVSSIRLNRTEASLLADETVSLTALVSADAAEQTVSWSAEPEGVVELEVEGNFCTVIPADNGTAAVTVSAGPAKAVCTVRSQVFIKNPAFIEAVNTQCGWTKESDGTVRLTAGNLEKIRAVTTLVVSNKGLTDLSGIEWFTALTNLTCNNNQLTALDVLKNTELTGLSCQYNRLTELNVSKNTALTGLYCYGNRLTELDVSANTALTYLVCFDNRLTALDVSANTALERLWCNNNQLTTLDVSKNTVLTDLDCDGNRLTELDVSKNTVLRNLSCQYNRLTSLDVSDGAALTGLYCHSNRLTELDVSDCAALTILGCYNNRLAELDVSKNTALTGLVCYGNQLTSLDVSANTALMSLLCGSQISGKLTLTLNEEQKTTWENQWKNGYSNSENVVLAE